MILGSKGCKKKEHAFGEAEAKREKDIEKPNSRNESRPVTFMGNV